jgi:hypothetical protein
MIGVSEKKYAEYIVTEDTRPEGPPPAGFMKRMQDQREAGDFLDSFHLLRLNEQIANGAMYFDAVWMNDLHGAHGVQVEIQHSHDFDEILGFFGSKKTDPRDLDAEIELWLEDEQYFITRSALVFVPKGMKHLPLYFRRIGSPVLFFTTGNGTAYTRTTGKE